MAKIKYDVAALDVVVRAACAARREGKIWSEVFADAKKAGFLGGSSSLQKFVRDHPAESTPPNRKMIRPLGNKNVVKAADTTSAPASPESARVNETPESLLNQLPVLREGTKYARPISLFEGDFQHSREGEIVAWSRILEKVEAVCVVNSHPSSTRGADILVDSTLNPPGSVLTVIHSAHNAETALPLGAQLPVQRRWDGTAFVAIATWPRQRHWS